MVGWCCPSRSQREKLRPSPLPGRARVFLERGLFGSQDSRPSGAIPMGGGCYPSQRTAEKLRPSPLPGRAKVFLERGLFGSRDSRPSGAIPMGGWCYPSQRPAEKLRPSPPPGRARVFLERRRATFALLGGRKPGRQPNIWDGNKEDADLAKIPLGTIRASALFVDGPASTCLSAEFGPGPLFWG